MALHVLDLPLFASLAFIAGPVLFARSFRDFRTQRLIQNTPTSRIRSMPMGLVEVQGGVVPRSTVMAPFSNRPCAYWEVDISTETRRGQWHVVHRNHSGHPFFLQDDTGVVMVLPSGADTRINFGVEEECAGLSLPECYARYMRDENLALRDLWQLSSMRFRERLLEEGQQVFVLGTAMPRSRALTVGEGEELAATGTEDPQAHRLRELSEQSSAVLRQGEIQDTFIISQQSQRDLTTSLSLRAIAELTGGPLLTLFGLGYWVYTLSARFGPR
jgi:hypothetical protein